MFVKLVTMGFVPYLGGFLLPGVIAAILLIRRDAVRPWFFVLSLSPLVTWAAAGQLCVVFGFNRGTLANAAFEPFAVGLVTGLLLLPVAFAGESTAARRQVLIALLLGAALGMAVGVRFPTLVE
jgi:hypothetical protein